jgi:hypothetical protein
MNDMNDVMAKTLPTPVATCSEQSSDEDALPSISILIIERDANEAESVGYDPYNRVPVAPEKVSTQ